MYVDVSNLAPGGAKRYLRVQGEDGRLFRFDLGNPFSITISSIFGRTAVCSPFPGRGARREGDTYLSQSKERKSGRHYKSRCVQCMSWRRPGSWLRLPALRIFLEMGLVLHAESC